MGAARPSAGDIDVALADALTLLVARAGDVICAETPDRVAVRVKPDRTPVTAADEASERLIAAGLDTLLPGLPVVSEERDNRPPAGPFVLVDPLDGTKEFLAGRPEFTVNLALVRERYPIAGFIAVPAAGVVYSGVIGRGALRISIDRRDGAPTCGTRTVIQTRRAPMGGLVATVSRSHPDAATEAMLARMPVAERTIAGSALKFCRIAEGRADVYPRLGRTREWDIAAGHALVVAAGGVVTAGDGSALTYGHAETEYAVEGFLAWGDPTAAAPLRP